MKIDTRGWGGKRLIIIFSGYNETLKSITGKDISKERNPSFIKIYPYNEIITFIYDVYTPVILVMSIMATKPIPLRFSDELSERVKKVAKVKELPFGTMCRLLIVERLNEIEALTPVPLATKPEAQGSTALIELGGCND